MKKNPRNRLLSKEFWLLALWGLSGLLASCIRLHPDEQIYDYVQRLNDRNVSSCLYYSGAFAPYVSIHGVTATGQATLETCRTTGWFQ